MGRHVTQVLFYHRYSHIPWLRTLFVSWSHLNLRGPPHGATLHYNARDLVTTLDSFVMRNLPPSPPLPKYMNTRSWRCFLYSLTHFLIHAFFRVANQCYRPWSVLMAITTSPVPPHGSHCRDPITWIPTTVRHLPFHRAAKICRKCWSYIRKSKVLWAIFFGSIVLEFY